MTTDHFIQFIQAPEKLNQETLPLLKEMIEQYPAFEAGWILYLKNLKNLNDSSFGQELIHVAPRIQDRRKLYLLLNGKTLENELSEEVPVQTAASEDHDIFQMIFPTEYQLNTSSKSDAAINESEQSIHEKTEKKMSLIEKFLVTQPKMPPIKEIEPVSPMVSEKPQEEESDDFVTETLASIYSQQGYYKKAIQIFEKLSLKYPEKSAYFAAQILKIKNLVNN